MNDNDMDTRYPDSQPSDGHDPLDLPMSERFGSDGTVEPEPTVPMAVPPTAPGEDDAEDTVVMAATDAMGPLDVVEDTVAIETAAAPEAPEDTVILEQATAPQADGDTETKVDSAIRAEEPVQESRSDASPVPPAATGADAPAGPAPSTQVPLYATAPVPPQSQAPEGPSGATIVLGAITVVVGILALVVGACLGSTFPAFFQLPDLGSYLFAGLGVFLALVAIVWGIAAAVRKRRS